MFSPSGDLNAGAISINGQRESANGYLVNGADAEETGSMAAAIIPNLDSIAEFRILSDNFDAEYGKYTGGQINVITKSGTNQFHGDAFEFLRNTDLDARNPFSPTRATYIQNQFGGTAGGPIVRNKIFFFSDYQGTRQIQGTDTGLISVPTMQERTGNFLNADGTSVADGYSEFGPEPEPGDRLLHRGSTDAEARLPRHGGEPYYLPGMHQCHVRFSGRGDPAERVVRSSPGLVEIYSGCQTDQGDEFTTSAYSQILRDDKIGERVDANTRWGTIFGYYSFDDYSLNNPYPIAQAGASVPGFNGLNTGRAQLFDLGDHQNAWNQRRQRISRQLHARLKRSGEAGWRAGCQPRLAGFYRHCPAGAQPGRGKRHLQWLLHWVCSPGVPSD